MLLISFIKVLIKFQFLSFCLVAKSDVLRCHFELLGVVWRVEIG